MNDLFKKYKNLHFDKEIIGLAVEDNGDYFCTPVGAEIIGWDNGIHYCFIKGFGDMVFCVNPETCCDYYVYPLAENFRDFLGLILSVGTTNTLQQIIWWNKDTFNDFFNSDYETEFRNSPQLQNQLDVIKAQLGIAPLENPFDYVKDIQKYFPYEKIEFSDEFYDITGVEKP